MAVAADSPAGLVYLVEQNIQLQQSIGLMLEDLGVEVRSYCDAESFLADCSPGGSQCLITELDLPNMSGVELLHRLREQGYTLPVIVLTSGGDVPTAVQAIREGALDFIQKPFVVQRLKKRVRQALASQAPD